MKTKSILIAVAIASCLAMVPAAFAQTDGSTLFTLNVDLSTLSQNDYVGYVGSQFLSAGGGSGEQVNYLGFYDAGGDGLTESHTIALWETGWNGQSSRGLLAEITVPAGTSAPLIDGYRWVELPSTITLVPNEYYLLNASVDGVDQWGDVISGSQITWDSQYVPTDPGYDFTKAGIYGNSIPAYSQNGGSDSIDPAANLDLMWFLPPNHQLWLCWGLERPCCLELHEIGKAKGLVNRKAATSSGGFFWTPK